MGSPPSSDEHGRRLCRLAVGRGPVEGPAGGAGQGHCPYPLPLSAARRQQLALVRSRAGRLSGGTCSSVWATGRRPTPACVLLNPLKPFGAATGSPIMALCPVLGMAGLALLPVAALLARWVRVAPQWACFRLLVATLQLHRLLFPSPHAASVYNSPSPSFPFP